MTNKAIPRITVRIDRGEDWVEISEDWQSPKLTLCGEGDLNEWLDVIKINDAWNTLNEAVME